MSSTDRVSYLNLLFRSTLDLLAGGTVALTSDYLFKNSWDLAISGEQERLDSSKILLLKTSRVWLQMAVTVLFSHELRNLYTTPDTVDPLGGLMFILPLASLMPAFWSKVTELFITAKIALLEQSMETSSENKN